MNDYEKRDFEFPIEIDLKTESQEGSREVDSESVDE